MKNIVLFSLLLLCLRGYAQNINIPDPKFKNFLITTAKIDKNKDGEIQYSEASSVTSLSIYDTTVDSISGLEEFENLRILSISGDVKINKYEVVLSNLKKLSDFSFYEFNSNALIFENLDSIKSILVSGSLGVFSSPVSVIASHLTNLKFFSIDSRLIPSSIQLEDLPNLANLTIAGTNIKKLGVRNLPKVSKVNLSSNGPIKADSLILDNLSNLTELDIASVAKSMLLLNLPRLLTLTVTGTLLTPIEIADMQKLAYIKISANTPKLRIQNLPSLELLKIPDYNVLDTIIIKDNKLLESCEIYGANVSKIYLDSLPVLSYLVVTGSVFADSLCIKNFPKLSQLYLDITAKYFLATNLPNLTSWKTANLKVAETISINNLQNLEFVDGQKYNCKYLVFENLPKLRSLTFWELQVNNYEIKNLASLEELVCGNLIVSSFIIDSKFNCPLLSKIALTGNDVDIDKIEISSLQNLVELTLGGFNIKTDTSVILKNLQKISLVRFTAINRLIDLSQLKQLTSIAYFSPKFDGFFFSDFQILQFLALDNIPEKSSIVLKSLGTNNGDRNLKLGIEARNCKKVEIENCHNIEFSSISPTYDCTGDTLSVKKSKLANSTFEAYKFSYVELDNVVNLKTISYDGDTLPARKVLNFYNLLEVERVYLSRCDFFDTIVLHNLPKLGLLEVLRAKNFPIELATVKSLSSLIVDGILSSIDVSKNELLTYLGTTGVDSINVEQNANLLELYIEKSKQKALNLSKNPKLNKITIQNCDINEVNFDNNQLLENVTISQNNITKLDLNRNRKLKSLRCNKNKIQEIIGLDSINIVTFDCSDNKITSLSLSATSFANLTSFKVSNNLLTKLYIDKQCLYFYDSINKAQKFVLTGNPIGSICLGGTGKSNLNFYQKTLGLLQLNKITNCIISEDCVFSGTSDSTNIITGISLFDKQLDGCKTADTIKYFVNYGINTGQSRAILLGNANGKYQFSLTNGNYALYPYLPYSKRFAFLPDTFKVSLLNKKTPTIQNFCIVPVGKENDVDITIIPTQAARPGFTAKYVVKCRNKGNYISTGKIAIGFDSKVMKLVGTTPTYNALSSGLVSWDYKLNPFESKSFEFVMLFNKPTDTIPLLGGDVLKFTGVITAVPNDTVPMDNIFELTQTVVNAFDPNDKTCLQGEFLNPSQVGSYLDYVIRFENTGNGEAVNIIVKDVIDTNSYDINSIIPTEGSHPYQMKIRGNVVEFIFENINLPFTGDGKHGFIAFKIKSKPNLVLGNLIKNSAAIYFDYNKAIVTNEAITKVALKVKNEDIIDDTIIKVFPNPTSNFINIETSEKINKLELFSLDGKLFLVNLNPENYLKLDAFPKGIYILKCFVGQKQVSKRIVVE